MCGQSKTLGTVKKDGPNKGRGFWSCPKQPREAQCKNSFEWLEATPPTAFAPAASAASAAAAAPQSIKHLEDAVADLRSLVEKQNLQLMGVQALLSRVLQQVEEPRQQYQQQEQVQEQVPWAKRTRPSVPVGVANGDVAN